MNKTTKHYFINLFKRKKKILALYTFICFMAYPFLEIASIIANESTYQLIEITRICFTLSLITLGLFAAVLPIFTFKFSHTKKHVDTYFAIPMNRNHLFKAHFIAPILGACIPLLINYLIGGIIVVFFEASISQYFELLALLLLAFVIFAVIYSVNTFFVLNTNNVLDSVIVTAGIAILPLIFSSAVNWFIDSQIIDTGMIEIYEYTDSIIKVLLPYTGFVLIEDALVSMYNYFTINFKNIEWFYIIYYAIMGIVFYFLSKITFKKKKGENAEQLSTSFVTYPLLINVGLLSLILLFNIAQMDIIEAILVIIGLFVAYVIAQAIANRSMAINMKMILKFVVLLVTINGFNYISRQTEFFGINRQVIDYTKYDIIEIQYYPYYEDDENWEDGNYYYKIYVNEMNGNEEEFFDLVKEFQKNKSIMFKENGSLYAEEVYGNLNINYVINNGYNRYTDKSAFFNVTKAEETKFIELYQQLKGE